MQGTQLMDCGRTETGNWVGIKLDYLSIVVELRRGESFLDRCLINCRIMTLTLNKYNEGITITIIISTFRTNPFSAIVIEDDEDSLLARPRQRQPKADKED